MRSNTDTPGPRYQALLEVLRATEDLWNASRVFFARWDLSPSQFNILNLLHELPNGCSQIELSRQLIMHRSNVTGLVDRLEKRGLVRRQEKPADRRTFIIVLTTTGEKLVRQILPSFYTAAEAIWGEIQPVAARQTATLLAQVGRNAAKIVNNPPRT